LISNNSQPNRSEPNADLLQEPLGHEISRTPFEPFVDADKAAHFLSFSRKHILKLAIRGLIPAHPLGFGQRKTWRFLLSEVRDRVLSNGSGPSAKRGNGRTIGGGGSRKGGQ
jgi:hypothetical protein